MEIKAPDGTTIYRGDGKETTDFTVNIPESGVYARRNNAGVGRAIINQLEEKAIEFGYTKILLETRKQNEHAIQFYTQCGYLPCPAYGKYCGKENAYCFEKELMK